jgi:outer membrane protein assembly factor BamB
MKIKGISDSTIQSMIDSRPVRENQIRLVVAEFTDNDSDAISDRNVAKWYHSNLDKWAITPDDTIEVKVSTGVMFAQLRLGVKKGYIKELALKVDGSVISCILPNGKMFGHAIPVDVLAVDVYEELLYELL